MSFLLFKLFKNISKIVMRNENRRFLFSSEILGLENYKRQKYVLSDKIQPIRDKFFEKITKYMEENETNTIYTDDLKTTVYISETDEELKLLESMIRRYKKQLNEIRFSSFTFGPLVMRLLHILKKPQLAYSLFKDDILTELFDQHSSCIVLMDLLYENSMYAEALKVMDFVINFKTSDQMIPIDCTTLAAASLCKINTKESLRESIILLEKLTNLNYPITLRTLSFSIYIALQQNEPEEALRLFRFFKINENQIFPNSLLNEKLKAFFMLGQFDDAITLLLEVLNVNSSNQGERRQEIFIETLNQGKDILIKKVDEETLKRFEKLENDLKSNSLLSEQTLENCIYMPIHRKKKYQEGYKQRERSSIGGFKKYSNIYKRPGIIN